MTYQEFGEELQLLATAFDHTLRPDKTLEWFKDFEFLTKFQVHQICVAAKHELDRFPSVKYFNDQIRSRNWQVKQERAPQDNWVVIECPKCDGSFATTHLEIEQAKDAGQKFVCINKEHWGCPITFDPKTLIAKLKGGDTLRKADWARP